MAPKVVKITHDRMARRLVKIKILKVRPCGKVLTDVEILPRARLYIGRAKRFGHFLSFFCLYLPIGVTVRFRSEKRRRGEQECVVCGLNQDTNLAF